MSRQEDTFSCVRPFSVLTALTIGGIVWIVLSMQVDNNNQAALWRWIQDVEKTRGNIVYMGEVLSMSTHMGAATSNPAWEERYRRFETHLNNEIEAAIELVPGLDKSKSAMATEAANIALVEMENRAFELVERDRREEASAILASDRYQSQKKAYAVGMREMAVALTESVVEAEIKSTSAKRFQIGGVSAIFVIFIMAWLIMARIARRSRRRVQAAMDSRDNEIATRKSAETDLRRSEIRLESIIGGTAEGIITIDAKGLIETFNPAAERMFGYSFKEIEGRNVSLLAPAETTRSHDSYLAKSHRHASKVINRNRDLYGLRKDGTQFPLELHISRMNVAGETKFIGIARDATERRNLLEQLIKSRETAEAASQAKSAFLSRMSHELRTPLNAVIGFGQLLEGDAQYPLSPPQSTAVRQILKSGRHLLKLIEEILDLSAVEAGKIKFSIQDVDPIDVMESCLTSMEVQASKRGIELNNLAAGKDLGNVLADQTLITQVALNLVSNAVKYNREAGTVNVDMEVMSNGMLRISIADTGPGIPLDRQSELFQPFNRLGMNHTEIEGTGMGLFITKQFVENMGGRIGFASAEARGSIFWFELPMAIDMPAENDMAKSANVV